MWGIESDDEIFEQAHIVKIKNDKLKRNCVSS